MFREGRAWLLRKLRSEIRPIARLVQDEMLKDAAYATIPDVPGGRSR
jgi:hypothetical protein